MKTKLFTLVITFALLSCNFQVNINAQEIKCEKKQAIVKGITSQDYHYMAGNLLQINNKYETMIDNQNTPLNKELIRVEIPSTVDANVQPAMFYNTKSQRNKPLIVSLHSWSGDYTQRDHLFPRVMELDWNYISPNFRGPNNTPEACGSPLVISDIEDAIDYALKNANVDKRQIHIIGGSGGAHATLLSYMNIRHKVNSFSAWNPITNLVDWYYESIGRQQIYADHIFAATSSKDKLNLKEAISRSPVFMDYPGNIRKSARLFIYHGIHDGYTGSVPITHSLNFYNELIRKIDPDVQQALISDKDIMDLLVKRCYPESISSNEMIGDRKVHYKKNYRNIQLLIFEGGHEMLHDVTLDLIPAI